MGVLDRLPPFRRTAAQVAAYAVAWTSSNTAELERDGPLWVVLGDSAAQGVGASAHDRGYVGQVRTVLGAEWRVVNLSRSGARTREVLEDQLPLLADLPEPTLLTALVGANDATHTPLPRWVADINSLTAALPKGSVVGTVPRGWRERKARPANDVLRAAAAAHGLRVADLWRHTGPPYAGRYADGLHPNDLGYQQWAAALLEAMGRSAR